MMYCECGCGKLTKYRVKGNKRFISGHNRRGVLFSEDHRRKNSIAQKRLWRDPVYRAAHLASMATDEARINRSSAAKRRVGPGPNKGRKFPLEARQKMSESAKRVWSDPVFHEEKVRKMLRGSRARCINGLESAILDLLNFLFPGLFRYVGDGTVIIGGKNPDFVNEKRKLIIEVWGDYWHRGQDPRDRIAVFKPFGYSTLVIWEHELKRPLLIKKIREFVTV